MVPAESCKNLEKFSSNLYFDALEILANPTYHLIDAYPHLYIAYGKILAIPFTSCTPERTFSVLKRIKNRLRSTMDQERLESLMLIAIEPNIVDTLNVDSIINLFGSTSAELASILLK